MPFIIPANSAVSGGFDVDNSCRFDGSSSYLYKTPANAGNRLKYTFSTWVKKSKITGEQIIFTAYASNTNHTYLRFKTTGEIRYRDVASDSTNGQLVTSAKFRDPSAWYHVVLVVDEENGTSGNRLILYVNGLRVTEFGTETMPTAATTWNSADVKMEIGVTDGGDGDDYFSGYMAETVFIDGSALAPTDFGEFDEDSGIWKPIDVSGLTFGNNGFHLDFEASGNLGNDANGGTDFTEVSLAATDQTTDTCTNNFATWNGVIRASDLTLSEANTQAAGGNASYHGTYASIVPTNGKWYAEFKITAPTYGQIGIITADTLTDGNRTVYSLSSNIYWQDNVTSIKYFLADGDGTATSQGTAAVSGGSNSVATYTTNDIISIAIDVDNGKGYFAKNGTFVNSSNPANGTNSFTLASDYASGSTWFFGGNNYTVQANFGNPPYAISSSNADGDGFGNFEYAVPSGYFALCTKNLAEYG